MRPAPARVRPVALFVVVLCAIAALAPLRARAQDTDRLDVTAWSAWDLERFHSLGADTLGLSSGSSPDGGVGIDFRVLDLPMGKGGPKPALHLSGGLSSTTRILGPPLPGMNVGTFRVLDFSSGIALELPLDALVKGNTGVGLRVGWEGGYLLTRTSDQSFLTRSKARLDFVRTSGALAGSSIGIGKGRDDTFGWDAGSGRWDVRFSLQGRIVGAGAPAPAAPPSKPGARPAIPPRSPARLLWAFADVVVDTDGGVFADGLRARAGLGFDVNAFVSAAFTPSRP